MTTETAIDPNNPPAVYEWTGPLGDKFRDVREPSGTYYRDTTPRAVIDALESAMRSGASIRLWYGDTATGRDWFDEWNVSGRVGRSTGWHKIPLICHPRARGGFGILTDCIVRLQVNGREVYRHPNYSFPGHSIGYDASLPDSPWCVNLEVNDGKHVNPHARFKTKLSAERWVAFMRGERAAK